MDFQQNKQYVDIPEEIREAVKKLIEKNIVSKRGLAIRYLNYSTPRMICAIVNDEPTKIHIEKLIKLKDFIKEHKRRI